MKGDHYINLCTVLLLLRVHRSFDKFWLIAERGRRGRGRVLEGSQVHRNACKYWCWAGLVITKRRSEEPSRVKVRSAHARVGDRAVVVRCPVTTSQSVRGCQRRDITGSPTNSGTHHTLQGDEDAGSIAAATLVSAPHSDAVLVSP